jgi:uncharacterized alkaline shock family protein YloU
MVTRSEQLPCGVTVSSLIEQVCDGGSRTEHQTEHQQACPHCQAVLPELEQLWAPVRRLAADRVTAPPAMLATIMRRVRDLVARTWQTVRSSRRGTTRVTSWVVAKVAALAAHEVPGVRAVLSHLVESGTNPGTNQSKDSAVSTPPVKDADIEDERYQATVELDLITDYPIDIPQVTDAVRRNVMRQVKDLTGLEVTRVDISIEDVDIAGAHDADAAGANDADTAVRGGVHDRPGQDGMPLHRPD